MLQNGATRWLVTALQAPDLLNSYSTGTASAGFSGRKLLTVH